MIEFSKIGISEIKFIADYLLQNRSNIEQVMTDFGEVENDNGYGTFF